MARHLPHRCQRGLTLIELMVVVALAAVLGSVAVPSMKAMMDSMKLTSASSMFIAGLSLARTEAIKHNTRVVLCKSADGLSCAPTGGWEQGWIVFRDTNNNALRDDTERLVMRELPLANGLRFTGNQNVAQYVSFVPGGTSRLVGGGFQAGTLTVCHFSPQGGAARQIVLNAVGRPRIHRATVAGCA